MSAKPGFQISGLHVLAMMLLFFGTVIGVNAAFITAAVQSFPGEDVRRSYLQGLSYNDTLAERRAQAAQGWSAHAALAERTGGAELRVTLADADGVPIEHAAISGELRWPTDARRDHTLTFAPAGGGVYVAPLAGLHAGRWLLRAHAERGEQSALDFEAELTWPSTP